ncbi:MAG: MoaD/ThiS family protein [Candidatus Bathyarchaeia archaeon]
MCAVNVNVKAFGKLRELLGPELKMTLEDDATVADLMEALSQKAGGIDLPNAVATPIMGPRLIILINGLNAEALKGPATPLKEGDLISLLPPEIGG